MKKAIGHYEQALAIAREIGDRSGEGSDLGNLGNAYFRLGEVKKAIGYYEQALAIAREIGDRSGEGSDLGNLGNAYFRLGDYEASLKHLLPGLAILQSVESPDAQAIKNNIARLQKKLGEHRFKALLNKVSKELGLKISYELS